MGLTSQTLAVSLPLLQQRMPRSIFRQPNEEKSVTPKPQTLTGLVQKNMRYDDFGCRYRGIPHDLKILWENPQKKGEVCEICNKKFRWNKGYKARVQNAAYLKAHVRNFCQKWGATKAVYHRIYKPEKCIIKI